MWTNQCPKCARRSRRSVTGRTWSGATPQEPTGSSGRSAPTGVPPVNAHVRLTAAGVNVVMMAAGAFVVLVPAGIPA